MISSASNRNNAFNELILPRCSSLVTAIGNRMAYEAAESSDLVSPAALKLFEAECILQNPGWYVETKRLSTTSMHKLHAEAVRTLLPHLDSLLTETQASPWVTSPILRREDLEMFLQNLPAFSHDGNIPLAVDTDVESLVSNSTLPHDGGNDGPETENLLDQPIENLDRDAIQARKISQHNLAEPKKVKGWRWLQRVGMRLWA